MKITKTELWKKRIQDFHKNGLSRKEWCQEHQIPQSTFGYWTICESLVKNGSDTLQMRVYPCFDENKHPLATGLHNDLGFPGFPMPHWYR